MLPSGCARICQNAFRPLTKQPTATPWALTGYLMPDDEPDITPKVESALVRLIAELTHDQADLSGDLPPVISAQIQSGKQALAEAIEAAKVALRSLTDDANK